MDKDKIYELIQKELSTTPLILIGTGGTMPYGIPGMGQLAIRLQQDLTPKYSTDKEWLKFEERLVSGVGLEVALTDLNLQEFIINDIIRVTWKLINEADIELMKEWLKKKEKTDLGKIIHKFYEVTPQCVNVITTNYDRGIEYSCDLCGLPVNSLFEGEFYKRFTRKNQIYNRKMVNLLKVHGSLDWFFEENGQIVSVPLQESILPQLQPAIITPGTSKYERVLEFPFRNILHLADEVIEKAQCYLCIGYGFNDSQIQTNIIREIRLGKSIVVWTKELSNEAMELIQSNSEKYIIVQALKGDDSKTEITLPFGKEVIDEILWTQEGLLKII